MPMTAISSEGSVPRDLARCAVARKLRRALQTVSAHRFLPTHFAVDANAPEFRIQVGPRLNDFA